MEDNDLYNQLSAYTEKIQTTKEILGDKDASPGDKIRTLVEQFGAPLGIHQIKDGISKYRSRFSKDKSKDADNTAGEEQTEGEGDGSGTVGTDNISADDISEFSDLGSFKSWYQSTMPENAELPSDDTLEYIRSSFQEDGVPLSEAQELVSGATSAEDFMSGARDAAEGVINSARSAAEDIASNVSSMANDFTSGVLTSGGLNLGSVLQSAGNFFGGLNPGLRGDSTLARALNINPRVGSAFEQATSQPATINDLASKSPEFLQEYYSRLGTNAPFERFQESLRQRAMDTPDEPLSDARQSIYNEADAATSTAADVDAEGGLIGSATSALEGQLASFQSAAGEAIGAVSGAVEGAVGGGLGAAEAALEAAGPETGGLSSIIGGVVALGSVIAAALHKDKPSPIPNVTFPTYITGE